MTPEKPSSPISFVSDAGAADANILIKDTSRYQTMDGVGASLSRSLQYYLFHDPNFSESADSSALLLSKLKVRVDLSDNTRSLYLSHRAQTRLVMPASSIPCLKRATRKTRD